MQKNEKYPVTGKHLGKLDAFIQKHGLRLQAKIYKDYESRTDGNPDIYESSERTIWETVIAYCGKYYSGGCLEISTKMDNEEYVLFFLRFFSIMLIHNIEYSSVPCIDL